MSTKSSDNWWMNFLEARKRALQAMHADGKSIQHMVATLNLADESHAARILSTTLSVEEVKQSEQLNGAWINERV